MRSSSASGLEVRQWTQSRKYEVVRRVEDHNHFSQRVVLLVTLDVKNTFKSVWWSNMLEAFDHDFRVLRYLLQTVDDCLRDRVLICGMQEGQWQMAVTAGAVQGSAPWSSPLERIL